MSDNIVERMIKNWERIDGETKSVIAPVPRVLKLEVTNACNLKCKMCGNKNMTRAKGMMPIELGKRAIREAAAIGIKEVALFSTGEPLLCQHLESLILEAKANNLYCFLTSNGMLLDEKATEMLFRSGLDSFKCSIDGTNKQEYESIRKGGNFDILLGNIKHLRRRRDELGSKLKIICGMVLLDENKNKVSAFKELFGSIADDFLVANAANIGGKNREISCDESFDFDKPKLCHMLWDAIVVNYDGKITACCIDFDAELVYGDYNSDCLLDIWNNDIMQKWRNGHLSGDTKSIPLCNKCDAPYIFEANRLKQTQEI